MLVHRLPLSSRLLAIVAFLASHAATTALAANVVEYTNSDNFANSPGGHFFYSADPGEQTSTDLGLSGAFFRTGRTFAPGGPAAVCRFYGSVSPGPNSHFFSIDPAECAQLRAQQIVPRPTTIQQWNEEPSTFSSTAPIGTGNTRTCPAGTTPVLRAYNNAFPLSGPRNPWDSNHRFVRAQSDINAVVTLGWRDEGTVLCAQNSPTTKVFAPSALLAGHCVAPRADPQYGDQQGTLTAELAWIRSYIDETYLWYDEVPDTVGSGFTSPEDYFDVLKTSARTASGRLKDRFHFDYDTPTWEALQQGSDSGYGWELAAVSTAPPRQYYIAYSEPSSPAGLANVTRGARILSVDGADLVSGNDVDTLNNGLFPAGPDETHTFSILDRGETTPRTVTLVSAVVDINPVNTVEAITTPTGQVGYIVFNDHNYPAEGQLASAIQQLKGAGIQDLVLDLRYNGGGLLYIASQLAYMIAGPQSNGKIFEKLTFSDKRSAETNDPDNTFEFFNETSGLPGSGTDPGDLLPSLNFNRVFVITSGSTASASEAIINSLQGIGLTVIRIGTTTYGKPYGFSPQDNCGFTYFSVEFKGTNNVGFGDYDDGFSPTCTVADDFTKALGDPAEKRLAVALHYRETGSCTLPGASAAETAKALAAEPKLFRSPLRENRIVPKKWPGTNFWRRQAGQDLSY